MLEVNFLGRLYPMWDLLWKILGMVVLQLFLPDFLSGEVY